MNKEIMSLIEVCMPIHYEDDGLNAVNECLKNIFDAKEVSFHKISIKGNKGGLFLPIIVNGKNIGYYEIVRPLNKISKEELEIVIKILSLMHTNIVRFSNLILNSKIDSNTGLLNRNSLFEYCDNADLSNVLKMSCLYINVKGVRDVNNSYGYENGNALIKIVGDIVNKTFSEDKVFHNDGDKFIVFVINPNSLLLNERIRRMEYELGNMDIDITYGIASSYSNINLYELINNAENDLYNKGIGYFK